MGGKGREGAEEEKEARGRKGREKGMEEEGREGEKLRHCFGGGGWMDAPGVTCHMGSHSVTCHRDPTQANAPRLNPSQPGRYSVYLPRRDGRLSKYVNEFVKRTMSAIDRPNLSWPR